MEIDAVLELAREYSANVVAGMAAHEDSENGILLAAIKVSKDGREERVIAALEQGSKVPVKLADDADDIPAFPEADTTPITLYTKVGDHMVVNASGLENVASLEASLGELTDQFSEE